MIKCRKNLEEVLNDERHLLLDCFVEASDILNSVIEAETFKSALSMGMKMMMEVNEREY